jgi:hypothetical protein
MSHNTTFTRPGGNDSAHHTETQESRPILGYALLGAIFMTAVALMPASRLRQPPAAGEAAFLAVAAAVLSRVTRPTL